MRRRTILLGLGAATGTGAAIGSGAFSTASADRQVNITVADDANSFVALVPGEENGEFTDDSGDALVIDISGDDGVGVGVNTEYSFDGIVEITNNGQDPAFIWATIDSAAFNDDQLSLYTADPATPLSDANAVELGAGESVGVGLYIETTGLESDTYAPTLTIEAADEDPDAPADAPADPVDPELSELEFFSTSSVLDGDGTALTDSSKVAVWAEETAYTNSSEYRDEDDAPGTGPDIPLVGVDGNVVAIGSELGPNGSSEDENRSFIINAWEDRIGGVGTVRFDETHGQTFSLDGDFSQLATLAENAGFTVDALTDGFEAGLDDADGLMIASNDDDLESFSDDLDAIQSFVDDGGALFLHDTADFGGDSTDVLNEILESVGADLRFTVDQVSDDQNNNGNLGAFVPRTSNFNAAAFPDFFLSREDLRIDLDPTETYEVDVIDVADGDTVDVVFDDGSEEAVRIVGIDTPETGDTEERLEEYEGIDDGPALKTEGDEATDYAVDNLADETVTLSFDEGEGLRGNFGRLLGFLELPDGSVYNANVLEAGEARVYDSGLGNHDEYWELEQTARANGDGIWEISDQAATDERRDGPVDELFFPEPVAVAGPEEPVASEAGESLVAVDPDANVAAVGGPLIEESFEAGEDGPGIADYGVFPFLTNVIDYVGDATGPVIVDGGHGQFAADFAVSAEDTAYYMRYLEGQSPGDESFIDLEGVVDLATDPGPDLLAEDGTPAARALILSTPTQALSAAEQTAVADFAAAGGAVILLGSAADTDALANFDPVVSELGTDVEFTDTAVTDSQNNLDGDAAVPTTTNFDDESFSELFTAFTPDDSSSEG